MNDKGIVTLGRRALGMETVHARAATLAAALKAGGVQPNARVAILMRNDFGYLEAQTACAHLGAYAVPLNWHLTPEEVEYILADCEASVLLAHADLFRSVASRLPSGLRAICVPTPPELRAAYAIDAERAALPEGAESWEALLAQHTPLPEAEREKGMRGSIIYTSGTTGRPKGVRREAVFGEAAARYAELADQWWDIRPGVRTVMAGPMYHSAPNTYVRSAMRTNGTINLMPRFDPQELLRIIQDERISHLHLVPTMFIRLLRLPQEVRERYDVSSLEFVIHGAAPCPPDVKRAMIGWWGPVIHEYYGATETGMVSRSSSQEWLERPGTVGRPWAGRTVRVCNDQRVELPRGEVGEIYVSLGGVPQFNYHNADQQRDDISFDGLVTNGDVGHMDAEGYLFLSDRKKDMVISGGVNIYPAEIEGALATHPEVVDCAVIGIPDEEFGEKVLAYVHLQPDAQAGTAELSAYLRQRIAGFKVPRLFRAVDHLPRDDSGKLMKKKLRDEQWMRVSRGI